MMLAQLDTVRSQTPEFVRRLALGEPMVGPFDDTKERDEYSRSGSGDDLPRLLAANMVWYVEWPHVDRRFIRLFQTIPGYWKGRPNGDPRPEAERSNATDDSDD
jgi:hypothetical protein